MASKGLGDESGFGVWLYYLKRLLDFHSISQVNNWIYESSAEGRYLVDGNFGVNC